ncbi:hypothetical protein D3C80_1159380 [compost metagenome]
MAQGARPVEIGQARPPAATVALAPRGEGGAQARRQPLLQLLDHPADQPQRLCMHCRRQALAHRHQGLHQLDAGLGLGQHLGIGEQAAHPVAIQRIALQHLGHRAREQLAHLAQPAHRAGVGTADAAVTVHVLAGALAPLELAAVEIFQGSVAAAVAVVQHPSAVLSQRGLGLGAEDQPPAAACDRISHRPPNVA